MTPASTDAVNGSQLYATNQLIATIAGSSQYFQANSVETASLVTGTNAMAMGPNAVSSGNSAMAIGNGAQATQTGSIAMGLNAQSTGANAIAIGSNAVATGSVAMGNSASAAKGGAAYGDFSTATGANSTAVGPNTTVVHKNAAAFGNGARTTRDNQQVFGTASNTYTMPGLTSSASKSAQGKPTHVVTSNAKGDLAAYTTSELGLATLDKMNEGLAAVASLAQPIILPGQTFAMRAGWGGFDDASAFSFSAAGVLAKNLVSPGYGTLVADAGIGFGTDEGEVAGRAGLTFGW
ncbi:MAG: hypothetical protein R3D30_10160 [Hyphomicrobiales bacterium]